MTRIQSLGQSEVNKIIVGTCSVSSCCLLVKGLFYELAANTVLRDMCFEAALKLTTSVSKKTFVSPPTSKATDSGDNEETEGVMETIVTEGIGR